MPKRRRIAFESAEVTVTVKLADIPEYLKNGELFKSMQADSSAAEDESMHDADSIEVPAKFIKADQSVSCVDDAWSLLHSLRYWIVGTDLPSSLVVFCLSPSGKSISTNFWNAFSAQFPHLDVLGRMTTSRAKDPSAKVRMAIATGDVDLVRLVHETLECLPASACVDAAKSGNLACLQYVHEHSRPNLRQHVVKAAIQADSVDCLKYAVDKGYFVYLDSGVLAAKLGRLPCLQYLYDSDSVVFNGSVSDAAATTGHLDCLKFAVEECDTRWFVDTMDATARNGHTACLAYLREQGQVWDELTCIEAAKADQIACLTYLHENGCPWDEYTCLGAAEFGSLRCLQYAHEHGCPWDSGTCQVAAARGHLPCLQYAHEHGCPWGASTTAAAAAKLSTECLQYAHERGCLWNERTCLGAARAGSLQCLQYANEHGCPWDSQTCSLAASCGHLPCLKYAHEHGCPWGPGTCTAAASVGELACLQYAHEHGCPWDATTWIASVDEPACEEYLREHNCPRSQA